jgi:uncharacterized protein with PQ loop repeat
MLGLRHLHQRKKKLKREAPTIKSAARLTALDVLIYLAAVAAPLALLPQALKLYTTHDAAGLALPTWVILGMLNLLWLMYGYKHRENPIMITNMALGVINFSIAFGIILYT